MPYRRRIRKAPRRSLKSRASRASIARIARSVVERRKETKEYHVTDTTGVASSAAGTAFNFFEIAQGDGSSERIGNEIEPTRLAVKLQLTSKTTSTPCWFRVLVIRRNRGVTSYGLPASTLAPVPPDQRTAYKVLHDRMLFAPATYNCHQGVTHSFTLYGKHLAKMQWSTTSTSGVIADEANGIQMYVYSTQPGANAIMSNFSMQWKE